MEFSMQFAQAFEKKKRQYIDKIRGHKVIGGTTSFLSYFDRFVNMGDTVVEIMCGANPGVLYMLKENVGRGKIFLIDKEKDFPQKLVAEIAGEKIDPKETYAALSRINVKTYIAKLPPYPKDPKEIKASSVDVVLATNAFNSFSGSGEDVQRLLAESTDLLKHNGYLMIQDWFSDAIHSVMVVGREVFAQYYDLEMAEKDRSSGVPSKWIVFKKRARPHKEPLKNLGSILDEIWEII